MENIIKNLGIEKKFNIGDDIYKVTLGNCETCDLFGYRSCQIKSCNTLQSENMIPNCQKSDRNDNQEVCFKKVGQM